MKKEFMEAYCKMLTDGTAIDFTKFPEEANFTPTIENWAELRNFCPAIGEKAEDAVKEARKQAMTDHMDALILANGHERPRLETFKDFIDDPMYTYQKLFSDDKGVWSVADGHGSIDFYALEKRYQALHGMKKQVITNGKVSYVYETTGTGKVKPDTSATLASKPNWACFVACLLNNCAYARTVEIGKPLDVKNSPYEENFAKANDMVGYGKKKLAVQMNYAAKSILPEELVPMFRTKDVEYFLETVTTAKNGSVTVLTEKQFVKELFVTIRKATSGEDYEIKSRAKMYNEKKK